MALDNWRSRRESRRRRKVAQEEMKTALAEANLELVRSQTAMLKTRVDLEALIARQTEIEAKQAELAAALEACKGLAAELREELADIRRAPPTS